MTERQEQLNIWDLQIGDFVYDGSPSSVCWGRVKQIVLDADKSVRRVDLEYFKHDPRLEPPQHDYIYRANADHALAKISAVLRPARLPVTQMNLIAILMALPQHPVRLPVNPVLMQGVGFDVVYYNVQ